MQRIKRETCPFVDLPVNLKLKFFYDYVVVALHIIARPCNLEVSRYCGDVWNASRQEYLCWDDRNSHVVETHPAA
jgi:hypothetical protein